MNSSTHNHKRIYEKILDIPHWRHRIPVEEGVFTPGRVKPKKYNIFDINNISGKRVLDVGAWDGLFSFMFEKKGADKVVAIDTYSDKNRGGPGGLQQDGTDAIMLAKRLLNSDISVKDKNLFDIKPKEKFDITLLSNVDYMLKKPIHAYDILSKITSEQLVISTSVLPDGTNMKLFNAHEGTKWKPDLNTLKKSLRMVGFSNINIVSKNHNQKNLKITKEYSVEKTNILNNGTEWEIKNKQPVSVLLDGDNIPLNKYDNQLYIELSTDNGPNQHPEQQGWVSKENVSSNVESFSLVSNPVTARLPKYIKSKYKRHTMGLNGFLNSESVPVVIKAYK